VGYPPFYADDPRVTCSKIINFKKSLFFPPEANLSREARDLLSRMICEREKRLSFAEIQTHPFFEGLDWDRVRQTQAPILPAVTSETDRQNFDTFDEKRPGEGEDEDEDDEAVDDLKPSAGAAAANPFQDYTFARPAPKATSLNDLFGSH